MNRRLHSDVERVLLAAGDNPKAAISAKLGDQLILAARDVVEARRMVKTAQTTLDDAIQRLEKLVGCP